jgi:hypothetical protein
MAGNYKIVCFGRHCTLQSGQQCHELLLLEVKAVIGSGLTYALLIMEDKSVNIVEKLTDC